MVWWLAAAAGAFYLLFRTTAPKASDVFKKGGDGDAASTDGAEIDVPVDESGKRRSGVPAETLEGFVGKSQADAIESKYDPAKNPFRNPTPTSDRGGSFDDLPDDQMPDVEMEDIEDPDAGVDDLDTGDESDGQI